jgi:hypothetical protein
MNSPQTSGPLHCAECGAIVTPEANSCWLCGRDLGAGATGGTGIWPVLYGQRHWPLASATRPQHALRRAALANGLRHPDASEHVEEGVLITSPI